MIEVIYSPLRLITIILSLLLVLFLEFFTNTDQTLIISIGIILVFLIIFTFIFKIRGPSNLKVAIILFIFLILPLFILYYSGFCASLHGLLGTVATAIATIIWGIMSIITIVELNYIKIDYGEENE